MGLGYLGKIWLGTPRINEQVTKLGVGILMEQHQDVDEGISSALWQWD